ncbi:MAG: LpxI family protein [Chthoniobacterales bacterium]|nr:LpxI family protein [Chthoniobacterales bacterium]
MSIPDPLLIIAGNGRYPFQLVAAARRAGVKRICVVGFHNETDPALAGEVDDIRWHHVGQLGKLLAYAKETGAKHAMMAGQIAPKNLFDLRPDFAALLLLAKLKERNAETLFGAVADSLDKAGVELLPATTFVGEFLAPEGHFAGPKPRRRTNEDIAFGLRIAKEVSRLDIGQTVVVRNGTVLAVEGFEGTNEAIKRGALLGRGQAVAVKVSKPDQDFRFDVPVVGPLTMEAGAQSGLSALAVEAGRTLLIDPERVQALAAEHKITLIGVRS